MRERDKAKKGKKNRGQFRYVVVKGYGRVDPDPKVFYNRRELNILPQ